MDTTLITQEASFDSADLPVQSVEEIVFRTQPGSAKEVEFELGVWLSGLESFLQLRNHTFTDAKQAKMPLRDWTKEFRLVYSTLLLCSKLNLQLAKNVRDRAFFESENGILEESAGKKSNYSSEELNTLASVLSDAVLLNEAILRGSPLKFVEWSAWSNWLSDKLRETSAVTKLIFAAEREGERFLPAKLLELLEEKPIPFELEADLRSVLPRFAKVMKWLSAIGKMHERDEPLKPTMLLFARINEQTQETLRFINNRLLRFKDEEDAVFAALDCAVYATSIELRKVYNFELVGFAETRQTPLIYARVETAHGLLTDSFQQTLINFAQLIEPSIQPTELFPNLETKLNQSLRLREDLWRVMKIVRNAEQNPEQVKQSDLNEKISEFLNTSVRYLFYKDLETVERFIGEVLNTQNRSDLVPILHRFGAYLETLMGQVNMRVVLVNHPFTPPQE